MDKGHTKRLLFAAKQIDRRFNIHERGTDGLCGQSTRQMLVKIYYVQASETICAQKYRYLRQTRIKSTLHKRIKYFCKSA